MAEWSDVVAIGTRYPGIEEGSWYGTPGLKAGGKGFCRLRTAPDALVMRVSDMGEREALLAARPDVFFSTPHYDGAAYVLIRLDAIDRPTLAELVEDAWRARAPAKLVAAWEAEQG